MKSPERIVRALRRELSHLRQVLRQHGVLTTTKLLLEALVMEFDAEWLRTWRDRRFDSMYRVRTAGFMTLQELGLSARQIQASHNYRGTPVALFDAALTMAGAAIDFKRFEFVDYGSGMGKALLLAARWPFRCITGVEFSPKLHEIAERNIAEWRLTHQRCRSVRSVLADATAWPLPEGDCLLFFFNPFRATLLRAVLRNIVLDAGRTTREVVIVYIHPSFPEVFDEFPELKSVAKARVLRRLYEIYRVESSSS